MPLGALDPTYASVHTLVVVSWAGRTWYLSPDDIGVVESDDGDIPFQPLSDEVDLAQGADLGEMASPDEAEISVLLPGLEELLGAGHRLSTATVEISRWVMGTPYEDRCVWVKGGLVNPVYGAEEEPVEATVSPRVLASKRTLPAAAAKVSEATWDIANVPEGSVGLAYPIPIGYPGINPTVSAGWHSGSQAVTVQGALYYEVLVIADRPVAAETVWINSTGDVGGEEVPVRRRADALGRVVSVIDYHLDELYAGGSNDVGDDLIPATTDDIAIYVGWPAGSGGILGPDGQPLRRAGDVIRWALEASGRPVDEGSLAAAAHQLRSHLIDGVIDDFTDPVEWVKSAFMPILPISVVTTAGLLDVVVWKIDATEADAVFHLDADEEGAGVTRESGVTEHTGDIANSIRVEFGYSVRTNAYLRSVRVGAYAEEYATVTAEGYGGDRVLLVATLRGERGAGITVSFVETGALTVVDAGSSTVTVAFDGSATTTQEIIDEINSSSSLVRAYLAGGSGALAWQAGVLNQERDYVTALRRTSGQSGDPACVASLESYPETEKVIQTAFVCDGATAHRIAHQKAAELALPWSDVDYSAPEARFLRARRGHVVIVSDSEIGWVRRVCLVKEIQPMGDGFLGFRLWSRGTP